MTLHLPTPPTDPDAFLRWNEGREGHYDLVRGKVVPDMIRVTRRHVRLVQDILMALQSQLDPDRYEVFAMEFGLKTPDSVRYPDIVVDLVGGDAADLAVTEPVLAAEVLSASSRTVDLVEKLDEYTGVPSLRHYLVFAQDQPRAWVWSRRAEGWSDAVAVTGPDAVIELPDLSAKLDFAALYRQPKG